MLDMFRFAWAHLKTNAPSLLARIGQVGFYLA